MNLFEHIPLALKQLDQWVCIHADSKVPMKAFANEAASSTNPETWSSFATAENAVAEGRYENIGFVFNDNGLVGLDIDTGYDDDGFITPLAADIIGKCHSYTERSRSGRGFHVLLRGELPFKGKNNLKGVEIYKASRYFIMTGESIVFKTMIENQEAIDYVVEKYFPDTVRTDSDKPTGSRIYTPVWEKPTGNRIRLRPVYKIIPQGMRNICLTSLAGQLHNIGYSKEELFCEIHLANESACKPPLPECEVRAIVNSVTKYRR